LISGVFEKLTVLHLLIVSFVAHAVRWALLHAVKS
jgi:hypothetical protein